MSPMILTLFTVSLLLVNNVISFSTSSRTHFGKRLCHFEIPTGLMSQRSPLFATSRELYDALQNDDDEEEEVEPGKMRVSEIKAELDLREVSYKDCFDKESLVARLQEARAAGRGSPKIIDKFNRQKIEETFKEQKLEITDDDIRSATANDGTLPGGMTPDQFKKLVSNPEIMAMMQSPKVQEAMQLMMTGGRGELENKLKKDPELMETITKLNTVLRGVQ